MEFATTQELRDARSLECLGCGHGCVLVCVTVWSRGWLEQELHKGSPSHGKCGEAGACAACHSSGSSVKVQVRVSAVRGRAWQVLLRRAQAASCGL